MLALLPRRESLLYPECSQTDFLPEIQGCVLRSGFSHCSPSLQNNFSNHFCLLSEKNLKESKVNKELMWFWQYETLCLGSELFCRVGQLHMSRSRRGWVDWRDRLARACASHYSVDACQNYPTIGVRNADRYCNGWQKTCFFLPTIAGRNLSLPKLRLTSSTKNPLFWEIKIGDENLFVRIYRKYFRCQAIRTGSNCKRLIRGSPSRAS